MNQAAVTVYVIDDEPEVCAGLSHLLPQLVHLCDELGLGVVPKKTGDGSEEE